MEETKMEVRKITNKEGKILTTKEGKELEELRLQVGDEIIPLYNSVMEQEREADVDGNTKRITNYSIKCRARDKEGNVIKHNESEEVFVSLTPTQAKSLKKKVEEDVELNQNIFVAYEYESEKYGMQVGVGLKKETKPAKTFQDFEKEGF